jgi:DHA1 family tetracycline resistance protein-like MFS transporter
VTVAVWAAAVVPSVPPLPRARQTVLDLARRLTHPTFLRPTAALAVGVGFLPVLGAATGLAPLVTGAAVSLLAACGAVIQPWAGRARDAGRVRDGAGMAIGLGLAAAGMVLAALVPGVGGVLGAAVLIGVGTGLVSPLGFAHLAGTTPTERLGQTLGSAEVGRELGDAGGPLLVGAIATATTLGAGLLGLAAILAALGAAVAAAKTQE